MTSPTPQGGQKTPTYLYFPPALDQRPIERRVCDVCKQLWEVRVPSVAQAWAVCPSCQARAFVMETSNG